MSGEDKAGGLAAEPRIEVLDLGVSLAENRPLDRKAEREQAVFEASEGAGLARRDRRAADQVDEQRGGIGGRLVVHVSSASLFTASFVVLRAEIRHSFT